MSSIRQVPERDGAFQLRGNSFTLMVLKLIDPDDPAFLPQLIGKIRQAPNFFRHAPVVLDLDDLVAGTTSLDFPALVQALRQIDLIVVGIQGGARPLQDEALRAGLTVLPAARGGSRPDGEARPVAVGRPAVAERPAAAVAADHDAPARTAMVVTEPVRSGRQVYAAKGDLVVLGAVSPGAELLADGHIHVYGTLRGRALAGISGDKSARIFCQSLEAELVSIAGLYRVSEEMDRALLKKSVQIYLDGGYLRMDALN